MLGRRFHEAALDSVMASEGFVLLYALRFFLRVLWVKSFDFAFVLSLSASSALNLSILTLTPSHLTALTPSSEQ
jgi:hypothetical protein